MNVMESWAKQLAPKMAAFLSGESPTFTNKDLPPWAPEPTVREKELSRLPYKARELIKVYEAMQPYMEPSRDYEAELALEQEKLGAERELAQQKLAAEQRRVGVDETRNLLEGIGSLLAMYGRIKKPSRSQKQQIADLTGSFQTVVDEMMRKQGLAGSVEEGTASSYSMDDLTWLVDKFAKLLGGKYPGEVVP